MTAIMAPAGLVPLAAPLPAPPQYDLLNAGTLVDPTTDRWLGGANIGGDAPGPAYTHDPCSAGTDRVKIGAGDIVVQQAYRFVVYLSGFCTASSIGPDPTFWTDRLKQVFQVYEGAGVERMLATGDGHLDGMGNHYLGDGNMETLGGGAVGSLRALELLENRIASRGGGMIHATPATATAWAADSLLTTARGQMRTMLGTLVAVGAGYIGAYPAGGSAPASDQEWAFASGPVQIYRDPTIQTIGDNYAQTLDRSNNDVLFIAERPYLLNWLARNDPADDDHLQAGVLVDLVP
jgi:hypothetical protein